MINLDFMPSKSLALYLVRLFLTRTFAVLALLVLVGLMWAEADYTFLTRLLFFR